MRASAQKHIYNSVSGCCHAGYVVVTEKTLNFYKYNTALYKISRNHYCSVHFHLLSFDLYE